MRPLVPSAVTYQHRKWTLKRETDFFSNAELLFEKVAAGKTCMVREDQALYGVKLAKKKLT